MVEFPNSVRLALAIALSAAACSSNTEATAPSNATIAVVSGDRQIVSLAVAPDGRLPQPVVVLILEDGHPATDGLVRVQVTMDGAPGPNGAYYFDLGENGMASLVFSASPSVRNFSVRIEYGSCTGFKSCDTFKSRAVATATGSVMP